MINDLSKDKLDKLFEGTIEPDSNLLYESEDVDQDTNQHDHEHQHHTIEPQTISF